MKLAGLELSGHRSVEDVEFVATPFTILFGKNNAGKTNILETVLGVLRPEDMHLTRRTHSDRGSHPEGAVAFELEPGLSLDDEVMTQSATVLGTVLPHRVGFTRSGVTAWPVDEVRREYLDAWELGDIDELGPPDWSRDLSVECSVRPVPLLLDWTSAGIHERVVESVESRIAQPWLAPTRRGDQAGYAIPERTNDMVDGIAALATDLLPDFVDGAIRAHVTDPTLWQRMPKVLLEYEQRGATQCADLVDAAGDGASRWMAVAVQIALRLSCDFPDIRSLRKAGRREFSRYVLLIDEPEAHLHPAAVSSMVRWCRRMVDCGFNLIVATHHEEFLRTAADGVTLVHVTRSADLVTSEARPLTSTATQHLLEVAADVGMHPATALSLHRAVLFVEGPLDEAVLDEYAGMELDAAGIKILPVHGTKNLEGLVAVDLVTELGIKFGILTDATDPATMEHRSSRKRSSEEKKVLRVLQIAKEKGLATPAVFGVPEEDLLFALPVEQIRARFQGAESLPEWKGLVAQCRESLGKGPSDSVNWKVFAHERYGVPIDSPEGVREVVRALDLAGVHFPSVRRVVDQIVSWAAPDQTAEPTA